MTRIVQINKGHFVVPMMEGNFELVDTITIKIDKKDINKFYNIVKLKSFKNLENAIKNKIFVMWGIMEFPNLIYSKIKTDFPEFFERSLLDDSLFRIDMIEIDDNEIEVHLDYLKRFSHIAVENGK